MTKDQLKQAQQFIVEQFKLVRPRLLDAFGNIEETIKKDSTPVTLLDQQIEEVLKGALTKFDPGIGFNGEESGQSGNTDTFWLIYPIDGTESFIRGIPFARNIITLIDHGQPVLAVVYKFITDDLYTAIKDQGAYRNGQRIYCSSRLTARSWVELSGPLTDPDVTTVLRAVRQVSNGFKIVGDFTLVLEGKIDAMLAYKAGGGDWDYAPRGFLMQEAGAKVANLGVETYDYKNHDFLAASPAVFDRLMPLINEAKSWQ